MPHISIAIPTFNRGHLIGATIESVLQQEFQDFDLLVVDDASIDNTLEVVREYCQGDSRVRLVINPRNLGLVRNWNRCLDLSGGPLVQLLQSDDLVDANYLRLVSQTFDLYPELGFVAASCRYIDDASEIIHPGTPRAPQYYHAGDEAVSALLTGGFPHVSSLIVRQECYGRQGKFDERIWHGPDVEMDARIASKYDFYHLGGVHTSFRRHGTNMGNLEYLRKDFLEIDRLKKEKAWNYLSPQGRADLGVCDLENYLNHEMARVALRGSILTVTHGRHALAADYFRQALKYDPGVFQNQLFWKSAALLAFPPLGRRLMQSRMKISARDQSIALSVELALQSLPDNVKTRLS